MIEIEVGDPQPLDCPRCKAKHGYQVSQRIQKYVDLIYTADGKYDGAAYSDFEKVRYVSKRPACANCIATLPFKVRMNTN